MHNRKIELAEGIILIKDAGKFAMDAENLGVILCLNTYQSEFNIPPEKLVDHFKDRSLGQKRRKIKI